jgi:hypothetical protein
MLRRSLAAEFNAYLERDNANPADDLVGYRQHAIWLSHDELTKLISELRNAILPVLANPPRGDRARYLLRPILFPSRTHQPRIPDRSRREPRRQLRPPQPPGLKLSQTPAPVTCT